MIYSAAISELEFGYLHDKPRRGDAGKPRAWALGSVDLRWEALKGRRRNTFVTVFCVALSGLYFLRCWFPGLAPWAFLRRPCGAI